MKVGILTYHFSDNYGALFQAYSLREWLLKNGHDASFVNYHPMHVEEGGAFRLWPLFTVSNLKNIYLRFTNFKKRIFVSSVYKDGMAQFRCEFLSVNSPRVKENDDILPYLEGFDLLICGSDQIWNPSDQYGIDDRYFLNFGSSNKKYRRVSYAPSFGSSSLNPRFNEGVRKNLEELDAISVREKSGGVIVKSLIDNDVPIVPDPTFLIDDFSKIRSSYDIDSENLIFTYYLRSVDGIREVCNEASNLLGADILEVYNPHRRWSAVGKVVHPTPSQWLWLNKKATLTVTNSFHGVAMSILQCSNFIFVPLSGSKAKLNARALELLEQVGLLSRVVDAKKSLSSIIEEEINWEEVQENVRSMALSGVDFLEEQLSLAKKI